MSQPNILVVPLDPYDPVWGLLVPTVAQRILAFAREHFCEMNPEVFTKSVMTRVWAQDPFVALIALIQPEPISVVGHGIATIEGDGENRWVYVSQLKADGNVGDAVKRAIALGDNWGKVHNATKMVISTPRSDTAWKKKYGFETMRHMMVRDVGAPIEGLEEAEQ